MTNSVYIKNEEGPFIKRQMGTHEYSDNSSDIFKLKREVDDIVYSYHKKEILGNTDTARKRTRKFIIALQT